jgi:GAF domain/ANTAR domain
MAAATVAMFSFPGSWERSGWDRVLEGGLRRMPRELGLSEDARRIVNGNLSLRERTVTVLARAGRGAARREVNIMKGQHERRLARVFVELADSLIDDFDVLEFLSVLVERCVELLDIAAAGIVLSDQKGGWRMAAASCEGVRQVESFAIQAEDGPCLDCVRTGQAVSSADLEEERRWGRFAPAALAVGFRTTHVVPMRLRRTVIGAMSLLNTDAAEIDEMSVFLGQALADVATIAVLQQRAIHDRAILVEQLYGALNSRVVIEQAKGVLSAHGRVDMNNAFAALRAFARSHNTRLSDLARTVAEGTADIDAILHATRGQRSRTP